MKKRVYITRQIPETGVSLLKEKYHVEILSKNKPIDRDLLLRKISDCDGLVSLLSDRIDNEVLSRAHELKIVANYAVGYDNIDIEAAKRRNIMVTNTPGVLTNATAEIAFALLIVLTRRILEVIDEKALVNALKTGKIKGAGLDVYEFEPEITHELMGMNNVVLLPHIGSATKETRNVMSEMVARNVIAALEGVKPNNLVPELEIAYH